MCHVMQQSFPIFVVPWFPDRFRIVPSELFMQIHMEPLIELTAVCVLAIVTQFTVDLHGPLPGKQPCAVDVQTPALRDCVEFAVPLCVDFADGTLNTSDELKAARGKNHRHWAEGIDNARREEGACGNVTFRS